MPNAIRFSIENNNKKSIKKRNTKTDFVNSHPGDNEIQSRINERGS
jgi:hypothetical protein